MPYHVLVVSQVVGKDVVVLPEDHREPGGMSRSHGPEKSWSNAGELLNEYARDGWTLLHHSVCKYQGGGKYGLTLYHTFTLHKSE
jgi:hypothetical protein